MQKPALSRSDRHYPALDGVRGIAIVLVMLLHLELHFWPWRNGLGAPAWLLIREGWLGVDLFFVLSGFLITGILLDSKGDRRYFRNFYARRALRIFPAYYVALLLITAAAAHLTPAGAVASATHGIVWCWTYLANVAIALNGWGAVPLTTGHFWSLAIEEQFYLVWPLLVRALSRRQVARVALGAVCVGTLTRVALRLFGATAVVGYVLTPARIDSLGVGALLAAWLRDERARVLVAKWSRAAALGLGAVAAALIVLRQRGSYEDIVIGTIGMTVFALFFGAVIATTVTAPAGAWHTRIFEVGWLRWLGRYSYGLYIYHFIAIQYLGDSGFRDVVFGRLPPIASQLVWVAAAGTVTLGCVMTSWYIVEQPMLRLKGRFRPEPVVAVDPVELIA